MVVLFVCLFSYLPIFLLVVFTRQNVHHPAVYLDVGCCSPVDLCSPPRRTAIDRRPFRDPTTCNDTGTTDGRLLFASATFVLPLRSKYSNKKGCAFLTYCTRESAINAQNALHEKRTLPGVSATQTFLLFTPTGSLLATSLLCVRSACTVCQLVHWFFHFDVDDWRLDAREWRRVANFFQKFT